MVGNDEVSLVRDYVVYSFLDVVFGYGIYIICCFIQNQKRWICNNSFCNIYKLFLINVENIVFIIDFCFIIFFQVYNEVVDVSLFCSVDYFVVVCFWFIENNVIMNGFCEQYGILQYDIDLFMKGIQVNIVDVDIIKENCVIIDIIEVIKKVYNSCFIRVSWIDKSNYFIFIYIN